MLSVTPYLTGPYYFDLETTRIALEMVCFAVRAGDCDDHVKQAIANKLIALAKDGEESGCALRISIGGHLQAGPA